MMMDLVFRLTLAGTGVAGLCLYFLTKAEWLKSCHLIMGVLAMVFCVVTFFK